MWETFMKGVNAGIMALGFLCCFGIAALIFLVLDAMIEVIKGKGGNGK